MRIQLIPFLLLLSGVVFPAAQESSQDLQTMLKAAEGYLDWQYFAEAQDAYSQILRLSPEQPEVHEALGYACLAQQKPLEAIGYFEKELALAPKNDLARLLLGLAHFQAGDMASAWERIGKFAWDRSSARKYPFFKKFMGDNPGLILFVGGVLCKEQNQWQRAEDMMAEALEQKYCLAEIMVQLADQYLQQGDYASARLVLAKLEREDSQLAEQLEAIVGTRDRQKARAFARSRPLLIRYFKQPITVIVDDLNKMARSAVERADPAGAFKTWKKALFADDKRFDIHYNLALIYTLYNFLSEGLYHCRRAIDLNDPRYQPWALNLAGNIQFTMGDFDQALDYYQQAIALDPKYLKCRNNLGATYFKLGDLASAETQWSMVIRNSARGEKERAIQELNERERIKVMVDVKESAEMIEASQSLAALYIQQKRATEAVPLLERVLQFVPSDAEAHFQLGKIYLYTDRLDLARQHLQAAIRNGTANEVEAVALSARLEKMPK
ncbi:MAG TPA: tetratricopeptide repeat protein [Candidatus Binatia bacterium]|nr:tetratricopeptide repeat protein [Candidatus Binatia bacterium]